jgi:hypothetical protein
MSLVVALRRQLIRRLLIAVSFSLVSHVMANGASAGSAQRPMACHMTGYAANHRAFDTALCESRRSARPG